MRYLLLSTLYCLMLVRSSYFTTLDTRQHSTLVEAIARTDDFLRVCFCRSALYLYYNQLQQLPSDVFSSLTSLRSLTCVFECIENVCVHVCV